MHAIEDRLGVRAQSEGRIFIQIENIKVADKASVIVIDNGVGLYQARFLAFCTTDTDFKLSRGGKGIDRLLWLDAFQ
jgi:hypothetical protein